MTPRDSTPLTPSRRRRAVSVKNRPGTAMPTLQTDSKLCIWNGAPFHDDFESDQDQVMEEVDHFPDPSPMRRGAKSFSNLRHPVDGLRSLRRRLSVTLCAKSCRHALPSASPVEPSSNKDVASRNQDGRLKSTWPSGVSVNRRPSAHSVSALHDFYVPTTSVPVPVPGRGLEPPILPDDTSAGSAARAAAAAQNELARAERTPSKVSESKLTRDTESGIGIDLRDHSEVSVDESNVVRVDPVDRLPSEILAQILSHLDPESLMRSELVCRAWKEQASSHHVWRTVFRRAYGYGRSHSAGLKSKPSAGLGKSRPNQNWKRMFLVRCALERRWKEGKAAAIYLHGHKDSVYCAQFDRNKIITGSRDRTIRVWDAHYPWLCRKIIGPPPGDVSDIGPVNTSSQRSSGRSPFLTICPPSTPSAGITVPTEQAADYHGASILCLQFDDEILVTGSSDRTCIVWDIKDDYRPIHRLEGHRAGVLDICFDHRYIVSCSKDSTICVWDRNTGVLVKKLLGHGGPVNAVQLRGDLLVSASGDGIAKLWNITSGLCVKEFPSKDRGLACIEFSEDARTILTGGNDRTIYQFDANTGELVHELKGHVGLVRSLHLDSANKRIVSGSYDMSVKVFDAQSGELSIDLPGWTTSWMLSVESDYRRIVATSQDSRAVIMDFGYGLDGIDLLEE